MKQPASRGATTTRGHRPRRRPARGASAAGARWARRPWRTWPVVLPLLSLVLLWGPAPRLARADLLGSFGPDGRTISLAGGGVAYGDGFASVFGCPATMAFGTPSLALGFLGGPNRLEVQLADRPAGYDIPRLPVTSAAVPSQYRLRPRRNPDTAPDLAGFQFGATASPGVSWLKLGVVTYLPLIGLGRQYTYFADEREQYFTNTLHPTLQGERLTAQQIAFGVAARPWPWLALGASMRFSPSSRSDAMVYLPNPADQTEQEMNLRVTTGLDPGVIAGVALRTLDDRYRLAATFRDALAMRVKGKTEVQVKGFEGTDQYPFAQAMDYIVAASPRQLVLAGGWHTALATWSADFTWSQWSSYRDDHNQPAGFSDTISPNLGAELRPWGRLRLRGGAGWRPSPVPAQTGRTNFVDNDLWLFGLGGAWDLDVVGNNLEISVYGQLQLAPTRQTTKRRLAQAPDCAAGVTELCDEVSDELTDPYTGEPLAAAAGLQTGNPGFPGYSSGGWLGVAGVQLQWRYP